MDVREKLVELIDDALQREEGTARVVGKRYVNTIADHLISHGVTVQDNTEITDELLKQLRNAPLTVLHEEPTIEVVQEWISVKDRLPEENERVLVWIGNNRYNDVRKDTDRVHNGKWVRWGGCVTHWAPWNMPQPPKGE